MLNAGIHLNKEKILELYHSGTLLAAIFGKLQSGFRENSVVSECARMHNRGEIDLLSLVKDPEFSEIETHLFFAGQYFYCKVIPQLLATPQAMMACVKALVEQGGNDLAANQPNAAFREWCAVDLSRAIAVIDSAEVGDPLASKFMTLALTAGDMIERAISVVEKYRDERRVSAVAALGRMNYTDLNSARSALDALRQALDDQADDILCANVLSAALGIVEKAGPEAVAVAEDIVKAGCAVPGPQTQYCCARGLWAHPSSINATILTSMFEALSSINPEHKGILEELDMGLRSMLDTTFSEQAINFVEKVFGLADGRLTLADFPNFGHDLITGSRDRIHGTLVKWMLSGDRILCDGFANLLRGREKNDQFFDLEIYGYELTPVQKTFLCRKAIGYFFYQPVIAASIIVAILRDCDDDVASAVSELLFDPLLINYGGEIRDYLDGISEADPAFKSVQVALGSASQYLSELHSIGVIKELHPSEHQRQIERMRLQEQSRQIHKQAEEQSLFRNLVHRSVLLYGRRSLMYVGLPGEARRPIEMELHAHSFSFEMPRMEVVDPDGLDYMLRVFRAERLSA